MRESGSEAISPRDREKFWYTAIGLAQVDGPAAVAQAEKLVALAEPLGYAVGPSPVNANPSPTAAKPRPAGKATKPPADKKKKAK